MPRVQLVKKARQRYAMVPDLDENGQQKTVPVMRHGKQLTSKAGKPVFRRLTVVNKLEPLPNYKCEACAKEIEIGMPYKFVEPKMGRMRVRCMDCPSWQSWDLSSSLSARIDQIQHDYAFTVSEEDDESSVQSALEDAAEAIRELAEEKRESASNIEEGFGHATSQSDELNEIADNLDAWADELADADVPERPEEGEGVEDDISEAEDYDTKVADWVSQSQEMFDELLSQNPC